MAPRLPPVALTPRLPIELPWFAADALRFAVDDPRFAEAELRLPIELPRFALALRLAFALLRELLAPRLAAVVPRLGVERFVPLRFAVALPRFAAEVPRFALLMPRLGDALRFAAVDPWLYEGWLDEA